MKNLKFYILFSFVFLSSANLFTQDGGLLWEISGKGLESPSYIFGTIHLRDQRAFNLNDSVIIALENSEKFVSEINMDSMSVYAIELSGRLDTDNHLRELLSEINYDKLNDKLKAERGISIDELPYKEPWFVALIFKFQDAKKDYPYSLDEFLYKISKSRGMENLSLETFQEQFDLFTSISDMGSEAVLEEIINSEEEEISTDVENLLSIYEQNDLEKLNEYSEKSFKDLPEFKEKFLYQRNVKMCEDIDNYIKKTSLFIAVGAAHLPGEKGLISLLKEKGYSLRPVAELYKGKVNKYLNADFNEKWYSFKPESLGYTVEFPGIPTAVPINEIVPGLKIESATYTDLSGKVFYTTAKFSYASGIEFTKTDSLYTELSQRLHHNENITQDSLTKIEEEGVEGREIKSRIKDLYNAHSKIFITENGVYFLQVLHTDDVGYQRNFNKFFSSFHFTNDEKEKDFTWKEYTYEDGGFKIMLPGEPYLQKSKDQLNYLSAGDKDVSIIILFSPLDPYISNNDSITFHMSIDAFKTEIKGSIKYVIDLSTDNYFCNEFKISSDYLVKSRILIRDSKFYFIAITNNESKTDTLAIENLFNSFSFLPYQPHEWLTYQDSVKTFSVDFVSLVEPELNVYETRFKETVFTSKDSGSGFTFTLSKAEFPPYYQTKSDSFLLDFKDHFRYDSEFNIISDTLYYSDKTKIREIILNPVNRINYFRIKYLLNGNKLYTLKTAASPELINSELVEPFFSSFKILKENDGDIFSDKSDIFFSDLLSDDTLKQKAALDYAYYFEFDSTDVNLIYTGLKKNYNSSDEEIKISLLHALKSIEDKEKISFIKENYSSFQSDEIKLKALEVLTYTPTFESISLFKKLILSETPRTEELSYALFYPFYDSLETTVYIFPDILQLIKYDEYRSRILHLMGYGIDSMIIRPEHYLNYENELVEKCKDLSLKMDEAPEDEKEEYIWDIQNIIKTFGAFVDNKEVVNILKKYSDHENNFLSSSSVLGLLQLNEQIDNEKLIKYAEDINFRNIFYNDLKRINKIEYFPSGFLTQNLFAESDLYSIVYYDYSQPDSLVLIDSLTNEEGTFYLYRFLLAEESYEEDYEDESSSSEEWYAGISGPQPLEKSEVVTSGKKTGTFYTLFNDKTIEEHWKELLETEEN